MEENIEIHSFCFLKKFFIKMDDSMLNLHTLYGY